jgi:imidazole glycerol-phosphate synthase subunit HisF
MSNVRLIARLDIKGPNLIKGINLEGVRVVGDPRRHAERYYAQGIDEIIYMDSVATLYGRNSLEDMVRHTAQDVFVPITVGGGIRSLDDAAKLLRAGADKIAINTAATKRPELLTEVAQRYGSQCMVLSIEAKRVAPGRWHVYTDCGRVPTDRDVLEWAVEAVKRGAGEILLTSVDQEGTRRGYDVDLVRLISQAVPVPVIASGGMGSVAHLVDVVTRGTADAVAMADVLHYNRLLLADIRKGASQAGIRVRVA